MNTFKQLIKEKSKEQRELKNQRKTTKLIGDRILTPWEAAMQHYWNRKELRIMHAAYGVLRGKTFHEIENCYPEKDHPLNEFSTQILQLIAEHAEDFVHTNKQSA